jgi:hypothetical protein
MIDVKDAVKIAYQHFEQLFADVKPDEVALEEVEITEDDKYWNITLGYNDPFEKDRQNEANPLSRLIGPARNRHYKLFRIDASDGRVLSMKIRNPWAEMHGQAN